MKKIIISVMAIIIMLFASIGSASAVSINDSSVFIKQSNSSWCTWASIAMMMRRQAILDGNENWSTITDSSIHYSGGLRNDFTSCGYRIIGKFFANCTDDNKTYLISMLKSHPEGVTCYMFSDDGSLKTHAVLVTDYNASEDMFYCADSASGYSGRRMKITEAYLTGGTSNQIVKNFKKFWYISSGTCNLTSSLGTTNSTTYYVTTLIGNGGSPSSNTVKSASGSTISLPTPTAPEGYLFNGWFTAASGGTCVTGGSSYTVSGNSTLYAQWRPIKYYISYDANGGSGAPGLQSKTHGEALTLSNTKPTREGYSFLGWSPSSNATVASYQPGGSFSSNADTTLYAVWKALPPSISASKKNIYLDYDTNKSETITFTVSGKLPSSYHLNANNNSAYSISWGAWQGKQITLTITATEKEITNNELKITLRDENDTVYATITLYVYCAGRYCTVNFDANGGSNAPASKKVPYNQWGNSWFKGEKPTRNGYTFLGWSTNSTDVIPEYCDSEGGIKLTKDMTLYAIWHKTEFSVVVNRDLNGGTGAQKQTTINIDLDDYSIDNYNNWTNPRISITNTDCGVYIDNTEDVFPTKEGYLFAGWKGLQKGVNRFYWQNGLPVYNKNLLYIGFDCNGEMNLTAEWIKEKWNGDVAENFASGSGTEEEPYIIENVSQMAKLSYDVAAGNTYENMYFELVGDIDMESNSTWLPIGYSSNTAFKGNFNGNNFKIYNFCVKSSVKDFSYLGLFGYCENATVENLVFENADIDMSYANNSYVGTVIGRAKNCIIRNINTINSDLDFNTGGSNIRVGDIAGAISDGTVINGCYSEKLNINGTSNGNIYAGGIVGDMYGSKILNSCAEQPSVSIKGSDMTHWIGGICGYVSSASSIKDCSSNSGYFSGNHVTSYTYVGGIAGSNAGEIRSCIMSYGEIESIGIWGSYAGGIIGLNESTGNVIGCISAEGELYSQTKNDITSVVEQYECVGAIVAKNEGKELNNFYSTTTKFRHGSNKNSIGIYRTIASLTKEDFLYDYFIPFHSFYFYEDVNGSLWNLADGNLPAMYKTSDFKMIITQKVPNGIIEPYTSRALNGTVVKIEATPDNGYHLEKIYINGVLQEDITQFTVNGNSIITPVFELDEKPLFSVYAEKCDNGIITLDKDNAYPGENVTITVVPQENYELDAIFVDGIEIDGNTFVVTSNHVVTAKFSEKTYDIIVNNDEQGKISLDKVSARFGDVVNVSVSANKGYRLENILVDGKAITGNSFVVSGNHTVSCEWLAEDVMYTIDVQETENGRVEVDDTVSREGSIITIYVIPNSGYELNSIIVNGKNISDNSFVLLQNSVVTATFTKTSETVSVTGVKLNKTSTTLTVGSTEPLTATVLPADATNKNVIWSSSNTSVATVNNGVVTAVGAGTATITVKTADGSKTATCGVTVTAVADENLSVIKVNNSNGFVGKTVDVVIDVSNNPGIALASFDVDYNSDVMTLKAASLGDIFTGELDCNLEKVPFTFNVYSGGGNRTEDGTLLTLQFEIKSDCAEGDYNITLSNVEMIDIDENILEFSTVNGKITVRNSIPGDVTGDGKVTRTDLLRLAKHFSGYVVELVQAAADVTGDGKVTRTDLLRLAKHFSGFDVVLGK